MVKPHKTFEQHGFARSALAYDKVGFTLTKGGRHVVEYQASVLESFTYVNSLDHNYLVNINWVIIRLKIRITILLTTTARVLARPTSSELPLA